MNLEDTFYHLTPTENVKRIIESGGLKPQTGENCKADDDITIRVYFVEGIDGLYALASRFMKGLEYKEYVDDKEKFVQEESIRQELVEDEEKFNHKIKEFSTKDGLFDKFAEFLKKHTCLQLDLVEDIDFFRNDDERMTKSNMYTEKGINLSKINQITFDGENSTAYDMLKYLYKNYNEILWNRDNQYGGDRKYYLQLLDEFMKRELQKEKPKDNVDFVEIGSSQIMKSTQNLIEENITLQDIKVIAAEVNLKENEPGKDMEREGADEPVQ